MKQEPASDHRDPSPDILLRGGTSQAAAQNSQGNTGWKEWTQEQCQEIIDAVVVKNASDEQLLQLQRAQFRLAEIHQNDSDHEQAVDSYEALLSLKDSSGKIFSATFSASFNGGTQRGLENWLEAR